jgi:signal transduction histidine kinase
VKPADSLVQTKMGPGEWRFLREIMSSPVITVSVDSTVSEAARVMTEKNIGAVAAVTQDGALIGILTERDITKKIVAENKDPSAIKVRDVMVSNVNTAEPETTVYHASKIMSKGGFRRLPVVEDGKLVGIVTETDIENAMREQFMEDVQTKASLEEKERERMKQLEGERDKVKQLLDAKNRFINQLSHDLRTPLTPLLSLLPSLKLNLTDDEDKRLFEIIMNNVKYLNELVVSTLDLARLDSGAVKFDMMSVDLNEVVRELISNNEVMFKESNIRLVNEIPEGMPPVVADRLRITEVLNNIIQNSLKFMPDGGNITFKAEDKDGVVEVSVSDEGIGVPADKLDKLFTEFYKADESRHEHSAGLGLAICQRIIEKHGGSIWAESPGRGTTIKFTLLSSKKSG